MTARPIIPLPDPAGLSNSELAEIEIDQRRRHDDERLDNVMAELHRRGAHSEEGARLWQRDGLSCADAAIRPHRGRAPRAGRPRQIIHPHAALSRRG
jgi:hypothetical protein